MKVCLISLVRRGGMAHYLAELANALAEITPTAVITAQAVPRDYFSPAVEVYTLNTGQGAAGNLLHALNPLSTLRLVKILRHIRPDVVHITATHEWNALLGFLAHSVAQAPLFFTVHDAEHHAGTAFHQAFLDKLFRPMPDAWMVCYEKARQMLISQGFPGQRIFVAPHGAYSFFTRWKDPSIQPEKRMLFFGRIEPYKGLDILLKAIPEVFQQLPEWKLTIAGSGDLSPYLSLIQDPRIEVINEFIPDEVLARLVQRSRLVVLPYREASQSGVAAVAFAFGRPVIATDVGSLGEVVIDKVTGRLVPAENPHALASAIILSAGSTRQLEEWGQNAYRFAQENLSWASVARLHLSAYEKIASPTPSA